MREDLINWLYEQKCHKTVEALKKNGFNAVYCRTRQEAFDHIVAAARDANTVGFGGSVTTTQLGLQEAMKQMGKETLIHNLPDLSPEEKLVIRRRAYLKRDGFVICHKQLYFILRQRPVI
jgi:hypothetical protein